VGLGDSRSGSSPGRGRTRCPLCTPPPVTLWAGARWGT